MKLLVVTQYFQPENFRVNDLVSGLVARGHDVTVLTGQPNYPTGKFFQGYGWLGPRQEVLLGAEVVRVPLISRGSGGTIRLVLNYLSFACAGFFAVFSRLRGPFDAVFVFEPSPVTVGVPAVFASRRFNAPVLFWVLDLWPESLSATGAINSRCLLSLVGKGVRWIYSRCEQVLVQSKAFVSKLEALGVPPSRIKYFPNWIEAEYAGISVEHIDVQWGKVENEFRIVFAGNIGVAQDFPAIIEAAEKVAATVPRVRWVIAGDGRMAEWVRSEVSCRGLEERFFFLGQLPSDKMPSLFSTADALLVTLKSDPVFSLTIPGKVQSYLSAGKPVLAMLDGEGAKVISESGGGFTCRAGDSQRLAELIVDLAADSSEKRAGIGIKGREYAVSEFGREVLFDRLEEWFSEAIISFHRKG